MCYYTANGLTNYYMLYCFSIWIDFLTLAVEYFCPEGNQLSIYNNLFDLTKHQKELFWSWLRGTVAGLELRAACPCIRNTDHLLIV